MTPPIDPARSIDPTRLVDFENRWLNHGGGSAEAIRSEFGLSTDEFFTSLQNMLINNPPAHLRPTTIDRMKAVSRKRLWLTSRARG